MVKDGQIWFEKNAFGAKMGRESIRCPDRPFCIFVQFPYVELGCLSELPGNHTLDIETFGPYVQIYDE